MTVILERLKNSFEFYDVNDSSNFCKLYVTVKKLKYQTEEIYYDISYSYEYFGNDKKAEQLNPLLFIENDNGLSYVGDIIAYNSLTSEIVRYLLMPFDELSKYSGRVEPQQYKIQIIKSINLFWD